MARQQKHLGKFLVILLLGISFSVFAKSNTPVGSWKTIDSKTGNANSIVKIWQKKGVLYGKVTKIIPQKGIKTLRYCKSCSGKRHNQAILGMQVLWNMHPSGGEWVGGEVLDPVSGNIYSGKMKLSDNGKKLLLRGYIGIPLFGRTATWVREEG